MSNADRIEELRSKYEENPRRYFAPLANEFRKAGDLAQAIAICREHLPRQPGHMSGYIVFGQTLFEANSLDEARTVFEQALALDPENLIALKHLGDIARTKGENAVARRWYERVLDADPRNDDIASQLASLSVPTPPIAMPAIETPVASAPSMPVGEALGVFATYDPSALLDAPEEAITPDRGRSEWEPRPVAAPRPNPVHEPIDLDFPDDPEPAEALEFDGEFEEGLIAPEWPDTADLVARVMTPFRSATPVSVPATDDALDAFGREAHEVAPSAPEAYAPDALQFTDSLVEAYVPASEVEPESPPSESHQFEAPEVHEIEASETHQFEAPDAEAAHAETTPPQDVVSQSDVVASDVIASEVAASAEFEPLSEASFEDEIEAHEEPVSAGASPIANESFADLVFEQTAAAPEPEPEESFASVMSEDSFAPVAEQPSADEDELAHFAEDSFAPVFDEDTLEVPQAELEEAPEVTFGAFEAVMSAETFDDFDEPYDVNEPEAETHTEADAETHAEPEVVARATPDEATPTFVTETMAELLVAQGFVPRAIEIYEELVRRRAYDPVLNARLAELRHVQQQPRSATPLRNTPLYVTPQSFTPLNVSAQSFTPLGTTPLIVPALSEQGYAARTSQDNVVALRTARERFAELARRRVPRRTPTHATAVSDDAADGLSSLFGSALPTTPDELAARALADAFGPVQDSGESLFDMPESATPAMPFRAFTPRSNSAVPASMSGTSSAEGRVERASTSDYSFDRFFPDPAVSSSTAGGASSIPPAAPAAAQPPNEDLAQFSAWLKGLNNA